MQSTTCCQDAVLSSAMSLPDAGKHHMALTTTREERPRRGGDPLGIDWGEFDAVDELVTTQTGDTKRSGATRTVGVILAWGGRGGRAAGRH